MDRNHAHWIRLGNDNPKNPVGKFRHFAQAMLQVSIELVIFDSLGVRHYSLNPVSPKLTLYHAGNSVLSVVDFHRY